MALPTLSTLRTEVKSWANRRDISDAQIDTFINIALERANRLTRIPSIEASVTLVTDGNGFATLPADYLESRQLTIINIQGFICDLERKDLAFVTDLGSRQSGDPRYFARQNNIFRFAPDPGAGFNVNLYYYIAFIPLENDSDSNWYINSAFSSLLYGALAELAIYIKDTASAGLWEAKFQSALLEVQNMADEAEFSGSTLTITPSPL